MYVNMFVRTKIRELSVLGSEDKMDDTSFRSSFQNKAKQDYFLYPPVRQ